MQGQNWRLIGLLLRILIITPYILGVVWLVNSGITDHRLALIMGIATPSVMMLLAKINRLEEDTDKGDS